MSDPTKQGAVAAAQAARATAMATIRKQAKTAVEHLQSDVLRLLEEAHDSVEAPDVPETSLPPDPHESEGPRHHLDAISRQEVTDIVHAEIAALDVAALVKAEIETQLRAVTKLLQERLTASPQPDLRKLAPMLSRRRR